MNKIIKTDNGNYIAIINGVETYINGQNPAQTNPVTTPCFEHLAKYNCISVECGAATDPAELITLHTAKIAAIVAADTSSKIDKLNAAADRREWAAIVAKSPANYTSAEIVAAAELIANRNGWAGADLLLQSDTPFSAAMLAKFATYTVTPFDDGDIIIKVDRRKTYRRKGGRFEGNHSLSDLLNDITA